MARYRRTQHHQDAGRVMRPDKQRQPEPCHAGRAHLVDGYDEVQAGKNRTEAGNENGNAGTENVGIQIVRRKRNREGPARIHAARSHGVDHHAACYHVEVPAQQVDLGQCQILGPKHDGDQEVPEGGRNRGHQKQENHHHAMHAEDLVVGVGRHQVRLRCQQLQPDQARQSSANGEEEGDRSHVHHGDPLVIAGQEPAQKTMFLGDEVDLRNPGRGLIGKTDNCAHCFTIPCFGEGLPRARAHGSGLTFAFRQQSSCVHASVRRDRSN